MTRRYGPRGRRGLPGCQLGAACVCGARVKYRARCSKCISRGRWARHKARRGFGGGR